MTDIIPAILPASLSDLEESLSRILGAVREVQVDVVDGVFAPNVTWPYERADSLEKIISEETGLPHWEEFDFEFDLMVVHPEREVEKWVQAGAARIIVHETDGALDALHLLQPQRDAAISLKVGIALSCDASVQALDPFAGLYDFVQVMGIARVGFQGELFDQRALSLVSQLRAAYPEIPIQVDGGVSRAHARALVEAGANRLIVGSSIFKSNDPKKMIEQLQEETQESTQ